MRKLDKVTIVGVGLIGGSIGLALKQKRLARQIIGVGHRKVSIDKAVRLKAVGQGTLDLTSGVKGADIVILATPILTMTKIVKKIAPHLKKGCIVTDVGSTKFEVVREVEKILPRGVNFIGGHPMAGSEKRGAEKARKNLFKGSICILTKTKSTKAKSLKVVRDLWSAIGAEVVTLSPKAHDRVVSQISHLPHMVIFSMLSGIDNGSLRFASTGFYDTTRIASSDAKIWRDIAISNGDEIVKSIFKFKKDLSVLEKAIKKKESATLLSIFKGAKRKRHLLTTK
ncbi:MAG: prephenate dehydrogenase [Candidatus Omnitrophica bacterium]|nr:prephenate dehydrogenase [Candidatus Omnitrophota bacterium]